MFNHLGTRLLESKGIGKFICGGFHLLNIRPHIEIQSSACVGVSQNILNTLDIRAVAQYQCLSKCTSRVLFCVPNANQM